jgi:nitrogen-specific signal transduction histidine kinase/CheY-like chemotaxis protein
MTHVRGYVFDATERHNLEEQLRQAQKLENLGAMAGGIAHDFNNILTIMSVHLALLKPEDQRPPHGPGSLDAMGNAVRRGAGLVSQLLTFARKAEVQTAPVSVSDAIGEVERMLGATLPKTIDVRLLLHPARPVIPADANQLHQVLLNLCLNARDAMPAGGTLTIATDMEDGVRLRSIYRDARPEPYVIIRVSDTGSGMDEATRKKIFEPFFTTKEKGKGTGLGLAVVYGVVRSHRGFIHVDSVPGAGSTFTLYFPAPACSIRTTEAEVQHEAHSSGETVLYVEDEGPVCETMANVMREAGYRVYTADDGRNAVALFREHRDEIDLVITDIGLPGQNGWEAYKQMAAMRPGLRAVFVTGFLAPELREEMEKSGSRRCVQKPYTPASLLQAVREALQGVPAG